MSLVFLFNLPGNWDVWVLGEAYGNLSINISIESSTASCRKKGRKCLSECELKLQLIHSWEFPSKPGGILSLQLDVIYRGQVSADILEKVLIDFRFHPSIVYFNICGLKGERRCQTLNFMSLVPSFVLKTFSICIILCWIWSQQWREEQEDFLDEQTENAEKSLM